jgi:hypothetical protein
MAGISARLKTSKKQGKSLTELQQILIALENGLKPQVKALGESAYRFLDNHINKRRKRPKIQGKPRLASAFKDQPILFIPSANSVTVSLGIGDIINLDKNFKYWKMLEYGGIIEINTDTGGTVGWFGHRQSPIPGAGGETFHYNPSTLTATQYMAGIEGTKAYLVVPKKPITGIGYLRATNVYLQEQWDIVWRNYVTKRQTKLSGK